MRALPTGWKAVRRHLDFGQNREGWWLLMKSHYIPRFLLQKFVDGNGRVHCYRMRERKWFSSTPENVGAEQGLYRIEHDAVDDPDSIEKAYEFMESKAAPVIAEILRTGNIPDARDDLDILALFVVDSAFRVPASKEINEWIADEIAAGRVEVVGGEPVAAGIADGARPVAAINKFPGYILPYLSGVCPQQAFLELSDFKWHLFRCAGTGDEALVTSDVPVGLHHIGPHPSGALSQLSLSPYVFRHWSLASHVSVALSPSAALVGARGGPLPWKNATAENVAAALNSMHCAYAHTIFSANDTPRFVSGNGRVTGASKFADGAEQARQRNKLKVGLLP